MMKRLSAIIFVGFCVAGAFIFFDLLTKNNSFFMGTFIGWFCSAGAVIVFFVGYSKFIIGTYNGFWISLIPINFGLAMLSICFYQYNEKVSLINLTLSAIVLFLFSFIIAKFSTEKTPYFDKAFPALFVIIPVCFDQRLWGSLIISMLFIGYCSGKKVWKSRESKMSKRE